MAQLISQVISDSASFRPPEQTSDSCTVVRHLCHELRQPLSTIESAAYFLQLVQRDNDPAAHDRMDRQLEHIQHMVHQANWMLSDALYLLHAATPRPQWLDLSELIESALNALAVDQEVQFDWNDSDTAPLVWIDPGQAGHLVRSLLGIYRMIVPADDAILIMLTAHGKGATLECSAKAPESILNHAHLIFEPFAPHIPGSGLALASIRKIAEVHGGTVHARASNGLLVVEIVIPEN